MPSKLVSMLFGLLGAAVGAAIGYFAFAWFLDHGYYALILPGALMGFFCGLLAGSRSLLRGVTCGIAAILVGLWCEWKKRPFNADDSLAYFLRHVHELSAVTILMVSLGALFAFWWGRDQIGNLWTRRWIKPPTHRDMSGSGEL